MNVWLLRIPHFHSYCYDPHTKTSKGLIQNHHRVSGYQVDVKVKEKQYLYTVNLVRMRNFFPSRNVSQDWSPLQHPSPGATPPLRLSKGLGDSAGSSSCPCFSLSGWRERPQDPHHPQECLAVQAWAPPDVEHPCLEREAMLARAGVQLCPCWTTNHPREVPAEWGQLILPHTSPPTVNSLEQGTLEGRHVHLEQPQPIL